MRMQQWVGQTMRAGLALGIFAASALMAHAGPTDLLSPMDEAKSMGLPTEDGDAVVRRHYVQVNPTLAEGLKATGGGRIKFNLFGDFSPEVVFDKLEKKSESRYILVGRVEGNDLATAVMCVNEEATVADIRMPGGDTYQIRYRGKGAHEVLQVVEGRQAPCGVDHSHAVVAKPEETIKEGTEAVAGDSGAVIDVLVAYTTAARNQQGGTSGMTALIDLAMTYANTSYANSLINPRVNLVHSVEVSYSESGNLSTDLSRVTGTSDGFMDNVHSLRDTYKADMVTLMVSDVAGGACGVAYLMTSLSSSFSSSCFAVCANTCVSNQTFAHELGHNMGCAHARGDGGGTDSGGLYSYSYGHRWTGNSSTAWRSVMAYAPGTRIQYFSNPNVTYDGVATGVAIGSPTEAYNAATINNSAYTIANFRSSGTGVGSPVINPSPSVVGATAATGSSPANQTLIISNAGGGTLSYTISDDAAWLSVSPGSGSITTGSGSHTLSFSTSAMSSGTYNANITVTAPGATNSPVTIPVTLTLNAAPANNNFSAAIAMSGNSGSLSGSNVLATKETGEPNHGANSGGKSVWWSWTAPSNGSITVNTNGSNFDTLLGVYTGSVVSSLTSIAQDDDGGDGTNSLVTFTVTAGTSYKIAVDGYSGASGNITLNWTFTPAAPPNNNFASATSISGRSGVTTGVNGGANKESGEPLHGGSAGGASVWWSWTAPASGNVTIDTEGSNFDTVLGVYTGTAVSALTQIAGDDDAGAGTASLVTFSAVSGTTYKIAVDGFSAATGNITLAWSMGEVAKVVDTPFFSSSVGWIAQAEEVGVATSTYNASESSLDVLVQNVSNKGRFAGWIELNPADDPNNTHLKYSHVGPSKLVRATFGIYARRLDGSTPAKTEIPNFNVRVSDRFGFCNNLYVQHNLPAVDNAQTIADDLTPSTDSNFPSVYRVDVSCPELPYYSDPAGVNEGLQRSFQAFSNPGEVQYGRLCLAESSIGVYASPDLSSSGALIKEYKTAADFAAERVQWQLRKLTRGTLIDTNQAVMTGITSTVPVNPVAGYGAVSSSEQWVNLTPGSVPGAQLYTSGVPDTHIGIAALDWLTGAAEDDNNALRARIEPNKLYAIRFYASATGDSSNNAMIRFRARSVKFSWTHRLEVGGAWNLFQGSSGHTRATQASRASHVVGRQYLPGTGGFAGTTAAPGGAYDLLMVSPMMPDVRQDTPGTIEQKFPQLAAQPGPGDGSPTLSRRDIFPGIDIMDTLSGDYWAAGSSDAGEKGNVTVHKIEIRKFDITLE